MELVSLTAPAEPICTGSRHCSETHAIILTFSDGSIRRITDSVGKGLISAAVGKMIRDDEIRPIAQQQRASDNEYSYRDLMTYDVNKDPTLINSALLNQFVGAISGGSASRLNSTKVNAEMARLHHVASPLSRSPFLLQQSYNLSNSGVSKKELENQSRVGNASSSKSLRKIGMAQDMVTIDEDLMKELAKYKPGELLQLLMQDNLQWKDGNGGYVATMCIYLLLIINSISIYFLYIAIDTFIE